MGHAFAVGKYVSLLSRPHPMLVYLQDSQVEQSINSGHSVVTAAKGHSLLSK